MVKRQTVWLSTMMVLSLMLIGYYTMNNDSGAPGTGTGSGGDTTPATTTVTPGTDTGTSGTTGAGGGQDTTSTAGGQASGNGSASTSAGGVASSTSSTDWYVSTQTTQRARMDQSMQQYTAVIDNNNSSADQISQATTKLNQLTAIEGGLQNAHDMIIGKGFKDCVLVPSPNYDKVDVFVRTDKLSTDQAVQIMHIVSTQLNISAANVVPHAKP